MAFCVNCGKQLGNGAKFCTSCGKPTSVINDNNERKNVYDGQMHKCPSCGELLNAFVSSCPACGYEVRGSKASDSVYEFTLRLNQVKTVEQRVNVIRNFPIPNTREDIFEFMILASTNISGESENNVFDAWLAKFEQSYQKARLVLENDSDLNKIQVIYNATQKQINKEKVIHNTKSIGGEIKKVFSHFPNPVFAIAAVLLCIYEIIQLINGSFVGMDIIFAVIVLACVYNLTNKGKKKK